MNTWLRRVRGAIGMGLTWGVGWAVGGLLIGVASKLMPGLPFWDSFFRVFDAPLPALAMPGFVAGAFFSIVLGIAARHRRFDELSLPRFAAWGALGGLLLILFPFALVAVGLASAEGSSVGAWEAVATMGGPFILFSAASASATLVLARKAQQRESLGAGGDLADVRLAGGAARTTIRRSSGSAPSTATPPPGTRVQMEDRPPG